MNIGRADFLPSKLTDVNADASVNVRVPGNNFDSDTRIQFSNLKFVFESQPKNTVERIVQQVFQSVKAFNVNLRMWNAGDRFKPAFTTNLDRQLASRAKSVLGGEAAKLENDLRSKLNLEIAGKQKEYEALLAQKRDEVMSRLKGYDTYIKGGLAMVQSKEKEVLKQQPDILKKEAGNLLKSLIPH